MDINIFTQIGFVVLVGLASKNAILIVEFAKEKSAQAGDAGVEATARSLPAAPAADHDDLVRVHPRRRAAGAGRRAPARRCGSTLGIAVFTGMLGVTLFGIFLTPVFYYVIVWLFGAAAPPPSTNAPEPPFTPRRSPSRKRPSSPARPSNGVSLGHPPVFQRRPQLLDSLR